MADGVVRMKKIIHFMKNETVLLVAWVLAIVSMFLVPPSKEYISYIDFKTLGLLLSLMFVTAGLSNCRVFEKIGDLLLERTKGLKGLRVVLVFLCFVSSMLITNDVALITFVPFTLYVLSKAGCKEQIGFVVVLQTIAANLGSMLTPFGNPQNLYLFSESGMSAWDFFRTTIPYVAFSGILLLVCCLFGKNKADQMDGDLGEVQVKKGKAAIYGVLFVVCIATVFGVLPYYVTLAMVLLAALIMDRSLYTKVDYSLILTFVGFFIFIGNMGKMEVVSQFLSGVIAEREILVSVLSSQIISNVPAALLLSGFTQRYELLLVGLNIGGLGTLIASMANLISYKIYVKEYPTEKGKYLGKFTIACIAFLIPLWGMAIILT